MLLGKTVKSVGKTDTAPQYSWHNGATVRLAEGGGNACLGLGESFLLRCED